MQGFEIDGELRPALATEHIGSSFEELRFPLRGLVRMHIERFSEFRERFFPFDGS